MTLTNKFNWQSVIRTTNITTAQQLFDRGLIKANEIGSLQKIIDTYPMSITNYYISLIKSPNYSDPIYKMAIASIKEASEDGSFDTSGEAQNTVGTGVQHKYDNTVLILSTSQCAMYCRHCFRKRLVGLTEDEVITFTNDAINYVEAHPEVDNVLITGGDSFLNSNKIIEMYLDRLTKLPNIKFIRFGTRTPVVFPERISKDKELLEILKRYSKKKAIYVVTQFNHPVELTKEAREAVENLSDAGIPVLNQTVLLKDINDDADTLVKLFNSLTENKISPYYLFQCRPVKGVKNYFPVSLLDAVDIVETVRARLSGVAKRFRFSMSHIQGKIEILGRVGKNKLIMKQHQARDNGDLNRMFQVPVTQADRWLSDDFNSEVL